MYSFESEFENMSDPMLMFEAKLEHIHHEMELVEIYLKTYLELPFSRGEMRKRSIPNSW